ncbi:MAG TPA: glycosyltransferase family 39 protein [Acidimicrobiia bacterium]|nr:glycosyltransferase family 39 protein [Acidimicrobiia bacterium]
MQLRAVTSFFAGGVAAGGLGGVVLILIAAVGLRRPPSIVVTAGIVVVVALAAWAARLGLAGVTFRLGAALAGLVVAVRALMVDGGLGQVEWLAVAASALAVAAGPGLLAPLTRPVPRWVVLAGLVVLASGLVRVVIGGGGFGHDESAYALKGRAWIQGTPGTGWAIHRGWIQSVLAAAVLPFTSSELVMRLVSVTLTVGTVVAVWWLGRTVRSNRVGLVAAAVFATGPSLLRRGAEFLTDVPSTGLLLVVTVILWRWLTVPRPRPALLWWAVVVGAVAFYWRYQALLSLGLLFVGTVIAFGPTVKERKGAVLGAAGLGIALLTPHLVFASVTTGRPWGVLTFTGEVAGREFLGEGLVDYLTDFPDQLAGQLGAVAIVVALVWLVWRAGAAVRNRRLEKGDRLAIYLAVPALGQILFLGLVSHGEPRFVFYPVALLIVMAAAAVDDLRRRASPEWFRVAVAAFSIAVVGLFALNADRTDRNAESRAASIAVLERASEAVVAEASGPCGILTGATPQMTWFSGCFTDLPDLRDVVVEFDPTLDVFLVIFENGRRQPEGEVLDGYIALSEGEPTRLDDPVDSIGDAAIWSLRPTGG